MHQGNDNPHRNTPVAPLRDWMGVLSLGVLQQNASPGLAIKIAYDFAKSLRAKRCEDGDFDRLFSDWVGQRFTKSPLLPYIRAGFRAGYFGAALPRRRQIEGGEG